MPCIVRLSFSRPALGSYLSSTGTCTLYAARNSVYGILMLCWLLTRQSMTCSLCMMSTASTAPSAGRAQRSALLPPMPMSWKVCWIAQQNKPLHLSRRMSIEKLTAIAMKRYNTAPPFAYCGWRGFFVLLKPLIETPGVREACNPRSPARFPLHARPALCGWRTASFPGCAGCAASPG